MQNPRQVLTPWGPFGIQNKDSFFADSANFTDSTNSTDSTDSTNSTDFANSTDSTDFANQQKAKIFIPYHSLSLSASPGEEPLKAKLDKQNPPKAGFSL